MDERVLAEPPQRLCCKPRDGNLPFIPGIDARRKTTEGNAELDSLKHGDEVEEQSWKRWRRYQEGPRSQRAAPGRRCGEYGQPNYRNWNAVVAAGRHGRRDMNGRRWNNAVEFLRVAKVYVCHSHDFILLRTDIRGRLQDDVDVGSDTLDPVHNSGPSLVEQLTHDYGYQPCLLTNVPTQIAAV